MNKFRSKRSIFAVIILLATVLLSVNFQIRPRLAPGQEPLTDLRNIETLRAEFN